MRGLTLDTGALIALESERKRMKDAFIAAALTDLPITVPAAVLAEWWRGRTDRRERILRGVDIELLTPALAKLAGEAVAATPRATVVDAIVMASAARRGDMVYTSDFDDLDALRAFFPGVRVLAV